MAVLQIDSNVPELTPVESLAGWRRELCIELLGDAGCTGVRAQGGAEFVQGDRAAAWDPLPSTAHDLCGLCGVHQFHQIRLGRPCGDGQAHPTRQGEPVCCGALRSLGVGASSAGHRSVGQAVVPVSNALGVTRQLQAKYAINPTATQPIERWLAMCRSHPLGRSEVAPRE